MSTFLVGKAVRKPNTGISKSDEIFLKEFSKDFHQNIININDCSTFQNTLSEWIKNIDKNILELMQNHNGNDFWFSSIIGFFYQYGIGCEVDENLALELYLLAVNNEEPSNKKYIKLHLLKENDDEFNILQGINTIIGKYLLSLFYYKDIILDI